MRYSPTLSPRYLLLSFLLCLFFYTQAVAASDIDSFVRGNQLYESGDFPAAVQLYEQLVTQGVADSALYYNLGNAYYKQGELGRAILNYTRAARLAPRDADIRANLALARSQVSDKYETASDSPIGGLLLVIGTWLTLDELAWFALLMGVVCALLWIIYRRTAGQLHTVSQVALLIGIFSLVGNVTALGGLLYNAKNRPTAIVVSPEVKIVSGPGTQYSTEFTLHNGAQVSLLERRGDWVRIALPGEQQQGWVANQAVAVVDSN